MRTERLLQREAIKLCAIALPNVRLVHIPNEIPSPPGTTKKQRMIVNKMANDDGRSPGFPDLVAFWGVGSVGFIELKAGKNHLSQAQVEWRDFLVLGRYNWALARSAAEVLEILRGWICNEM